MSIIKMSLIASAMSLAVVAAADAQAQERLAPGFATAVVYHHARHRHGWNGGNSGIPGNTTSKPDDRGNMDKAITRGSSS
jgi:hypothetical protein